jgi:hypothetical protein
MKLKSKTYFVSRPQIIILWSNIYLIFTANYVKCKVYGIAKEINRNANEIRS